MKTIVFDFGNVIAFFDHERTFERMCAFSPLTPQEMRASVYAGELEDQFERGQITAPAFLRQVQQRWQLRCNTEVLTHAIADIFWANAEVCDLIPKLKGRYRLVLGSNTNAIHARRFLSQFNAILRHFDALVLSYEAGTRKPDLEFFKVCQRHARAMPSEIVFVDDLADNVEGARAAGWHGIVYRPNERLAEQLRAVGVEV